MSIISLSGRAGSGKDLVASIIQKLTTPKPYRNVQNEFGNDAREYGGRYILEEEKSPWVIKKWAGVLRKVTAIMLGMDEAFTYTDKFKAMTLPKEWQIGNPYDTPYTGRFFLQALGTDAVRNGLHPNAWVNALMSGYKSTGRCKNKCERSLENNIPGYECVEDKYCYRSNYPLWIISDTRFPNELKAVKDKNGITIRVNRDAIKPILMQQMDGTIDNPIETGVWKEHSSETALDDAEFDYVIDNNGTIEELEDKVRAILTREGVIK